MHTFVTNHNVNKTRTRENSNNKNHYSNGNSCSTNQNNYYSNGNNFGINHNDNITFDPSYPKGNDSGYSDQSRAHRSRSLSTERQMGVNGRKDDLHQEEDSFTDDPAKKKPSLGNGNRQSRSRSLQRDQQHNYFRYVNKSSIVHTCTYARTTAATTNFVFLLSPHYQ